MADAPARYDHAALEKILATLLRDRPDSFIAAIDPQPDRRFVPIPRSIVLNGQIPLEAQRVTALDQATAAAAFFTNHVAVRRAAMWRTARSRM